MKKKKEKGKTFPLAAHNWMNIEQQNTTDIHQRITPICQILPVPNLNPTVCFATLTLSSCI